MGLLMISVVSIGCTNPIQSNRSPTALFVIKVDGNTISDGRSVIQGETLVLDASASSDDDDDPLAYDWMILENNNVIWEGTGKTNQWKVDRIASLTIRLTVNDEKDTSVQEISVNVVEEGAIGPIACAGGNTNEQCPNLDSGKTPTTIYIETIEVDKENSDTQIDEVIDVKLDGGNSGFSSEADLNAQITDYLWDLDTTFDSDGDGDSTNDVDANGRTTTMTNLAPGSYPIALTVIDNNGLSDTDLSNVFVDWIGKWDEVTIGRNDSQSDNEMKFEIEAFYSREFSDKSIRSMVLTAIYPENDDDLNNPFGNTISDNQLDLYIYNDTEEHIVNTSENEDRENSNCEMEDEKECAYISLGRSFFRIYDDGLWRLILLNEERHDTNDVSVTIKVTYSSS